MVNRKMNLPIAFLVGIVMLATFSACESKESKKTETTVVKDTVVKVNVIDTTAVGRPRVPGN